MTNSTYKRIILVLTKKPTRKQILNLGLDIFENKCYTRICRTESTDKVLAQFQEAGIRGKIIVVDEFQFASGNGVIADDVILCDHQYQ